MYKISICTSSHQTPSHEKKFNKPQNLLVELDGPVRIDVSTTLYWNSRNALGSAVVDVEPAGHVRVFAVPFDRKKRFSCESGGADLFPKLFVLFFILTHRLILQSFLL